MEGVFADYARLISQALGMRIEMLRYADRDAALATIAADQADMLFSKARNAVPANAQLDASQNLLINRPVVVTQRAPCSRCLMQRQSDWRWTNTISATTQSGRNFLRRKSCVMPPVASHCRRWRPARRITRSII